jgi:ubiquinone/menaquinone biosynthesis C-methylase UbiE
MDSYKQQVIAFYNARTTYDHEQGSQHPREASLLLEYVPVQPGQQILDIATGTGLVAIPAALQVGSAGHVIGVDMSPGMLHQAREKIAAAKLQNIELIAADIEEINFSEGSFDVIFCCSAIVLLTNIPGILRKCYKYLKPGGFIAFTCPPETAYLASVYTTITAQVFGVSLPHLLSTLGTPEKCHTLLHQAGFRDIEVTVEPRGRYRKLENNQLSWSSINLGFKGNSLLPHPSPEKLAELQLAYTSELEKLATDQGVWEDTTTFFVRARKL